MKILEDIHKFLAEEEVTLLWLERIKTMEYGSTKYLDYMSLHDYD